MVYVSFADEKLQRIMRFADFEKLCLKLMADPTIGRGVRPDLDNEFYAHFGMSAEEASVQLGARKSGIQNQKHRPIY